MTMKLQPRLLPVLIALAFSGSAVAGGFQLLEQNASGMGNAYAGSAAVAENASTVFYNPAGMTELKAREVSVGGALINTSYKFSDSGSDTGYLHGDGNDGGGLGVVPNAYLSWALNRDWYAGLGIGAPFGLKTEYDNPWTGAAQSIKFEIKTLNINPSLAWRVNERVSLGFGANYQKLEAEYVRAVGVLSSGLAGSTANLNLDGDAWGWNAGALFKLSPATRVGVSYRSAIRHKLSGDVDVRGEGLAEAAQTSAMLNAGGASSDTRASIKLPDTLILSATHQLNDQWLLLGDISRTGWSSIPEVDIIRSSGVLNGTSAQVLDTRFRDTWRIAGGANYNLDSAWTLKFGMAYDQTPVRDAEHRLVSLPDNDRVWFSFGAQYRPTPDMRVDMGATYLYVRDSRIDNDQRSTVAVANHGHVRGDYDASAVLLGVQLSMAF